MPIGINKAAIARELAERAKAGDQVAVGAVNMRVAQVNASKPLADGGLGLPDNNTATDRARAMGFDVDQTYYHGSAVDFDAFDPDRAIGTQYWSTTSKADIEAGEVGAQGKGVIKALRHKGSNPAGWREYDNLGIDEIQGRGFDSIQLPDDGSTTLIALKPEDYRSVDAAFDPAKRDSPELLASMGGMGVLGAGALMSEKAEAGINDGGQVEGNSATWGDIFRSAGRGVAEGVRDLKGVADLGGMIGYEAGKEGLKGLGYLASLAPGEPLHKSMSKVDELISKLPNYEIGDDAMTVYRKAQSSFDSSPEFVRDVMSNYMSIDSTAADKVYEATGSPAAAAATKAAFGLF